MWKKGADQEQGQSVLKELFVHVDYRQREEGWRHKVTAARVEVSQGGDHLKSCLPAPAQCSSNLSASEQRL